MIEQDIIQIDTLMKGLRDDDFDCVIRQEKLRSRGYTLHFVVDAGLIYNYCYPEGIDPNRTHPERRSKLNQEYIADEQVTLHSILFLNEKRDRVVFFDQYVPELEGMIQEAVNHKALKSSTGTLLDFENFHPSSDPTNLALDSFSVIIADVLRHINGLRKLQNVFNSKGLIIEPQELENEFVGRATELIKGTRQTTDRIKNLLTAIIKDELFESKKRDAVVFDRVLSINNFIQRFGEREDRKHVFILLTDSTIMKTLGKQLLKGRDNIEYPLIDGDRIELTRSVQQSFIHLISLARHEDNTIDHLKTIANLQLLKQFNREIKERFEQTEQLIQDKNPRGAKFDLLFLPEYQYVFENYRLLRNAFENSGFLKSFQSLYDSLKPYLADEKLKDVRAFFNAVSGVINELSKELDDNQRKFLKRLKDEAFFNTAFVNGIEQIKNMGNKFVLSKGGDLIEGSYQHLPIFLTFSKNTEFQFQMFNLLRLILKKNTEDSQAVCEELGGLLTRMMLAKSHMDFPVEVKLLKAFLFVILPAADDITSNDDSSDAINNRMALSWLELLETSNHIDDKELHADLIYLLCWTARRVPDYKRAIDYAKKGITNYPDDPRFYHGLFLAEYCIYENDHQANAHLLDTMLDSLNMASMLYGDFIKQHYLKFDSGGLLTQKVLDTFSNNYCTFYTLKAYQLHENESTDNNRSTIIELLATARICLNHLKNDKVFIDQLPEYYDTEANLEYLESYYVVQEKRLPKLIYAKDAIEKASTLSGHPGLTTKYNNTLKKINKGIFVNMSGLK